MNGTAITLGVAAGLVAATKLRRGGAENRRPADVVWKKTGDLHPTEDLRDVDNVRRLRIRMRKLRKWPDDLPPLFVRDDTLEIFDGHHRHAAAIGVLARVPVVLVDGERFDELFTWEDGDVYRDDVIEHLTGWKYPRDYRSGDRNVTEDRLPILRPTVVGRAWGWEGYVAGRSVRLRRDGTPEDVAGYRYVPAEMRAMMDRARERQAPVLDALRRIPARPLYLRFGEVVTSGTFLRSRRQEVDPTDFDRLGEAGMSCYQAEPHPTVPSAWVVQMPNTREAIHSVTTRDVFSMVQSFVRAERPIRLVAGRWVSHETTHPDTGEQIEILSYGADGEPLLDPETVRTVRRLTPEQVWFVGRNFGESDLTSGPKNAAGCPQAGPCDTRQSILTNRTLTTGYRS